MNATKKPLGTQLANRVAQKLWTNPIVRISTSLGLRRNLETAWNTPPAAVPLEIRSLRPSDIPLLLPRETTRYSRSERRLIGLRRDLLLYDLPNTFVAVDQSNNLPCFLQWMFTPNQNRFIRDYFDGRFPHLRDDQALLENAYIPPWHRGKGIMAKAMDSIAAIAHERGFKEIITFVDHRNEASLSGCRKAGFYPFLIRKDYRVFHFIKRRVFHPSSERSHQSQTLKATERK